MLDLSRLGSIGEALSDTIITHKTNLALIEAERHRENLRLTYRELQERAERFAAFLQSHEFLPGDRCAILLQNQARWILSATGAFWAGAVLVPLDYKLSASEQLALLRHSKPKVLVTEYSTWLKLRELPNPPNSMLVLLTDAPEGSDLGRAFHWDASQEGKAPFRYVARNREDLACIVYSSGTGGAPKGCMLSHGNYLAQAQVLAQLFPIEEEDRYFSILPTNHAIDFMCGFILPLLFGAAVVHQRTLRPQFLGPTMKRYGITHMALVPTILKNLETKLRERLDDLPSWQKRMVDGLIVLNEAATRREPKHGLSRLLLKPIHDEFGGKLRTIFAGGAFVEPSCAEFFYSIGIPVVIGYGLTEAGTVVSVNDLKPFRADSVGKVVPGTEIEIRGPNEGGVGEVWVKGPTVMQGYLDAPELTSECIMDGWLRTGDLGYLDASHHLHLVGRSKNMIVTEGGKNIYPEDIEQSFEGISGVEEQCVFAANYVWPTGKLTDEKLIVVMRKKSEADEARLLEQLRDRNRKLPDFKRISGLVFWSEEFPRTASLKIKRHELAQALKRVQRGEAVKDL